MSSIDEREHRNSRSFAPDLPSGLKDLLSVDLFSVYLLSRVDIAICYIEVYFMFGLMFVISRNSLYRGSLY